MDYDFKVETIHDLGFHREFTRSYIRASLLRSVFNLAYTLLLFWFISMFSLPAAVYSYLGIAAVFLAAYLISHPRKGDIQYKRILQNNNDEPPHLVYTFHEDHIHCLQPKNGNKQDFSYDLFRRMIESENLLILVMKHRSCLILDKRWVHGGQPEELIAFLAAHCPNMRRKKPTGTSFGKWTQRLLAATLILGSLFGLLNLPAFPIWSRLNGRLDNSMSYQKMADALAEVEIVISQQAIDEMEAMDAEYFKENGEDFYSTSLRGTKISDLLYWEGCGFYDEITWKWTPSTSGIYWAELEVMDASSIYTDFLTGLSSMDPELSFSNIQEDYSQADLESGTGSVHVSFDWNGAHYELDAQLSYDWLDADIIFKVGRIIAGNNSENTLYCAYEDAGFLFYYGTPAQMRKLERMTGLQFHDTVIQRLGY